MGMAGAQACSVARILHCLVGYIVKRVTSLNGSHGSPGDGEEGAGSGLTHMREAVHCLGTLHELQTDVVYVDRRAARAKCGSGYGRNEVRTRVGIGAK